jgi:CheY-like chemotaxis protein
MDESPPTIPPRAPRRPSRIMLIDNDERELELLRFAIDDIAWNATVEAMSSAREAIEMLQRHHLAGTMPDIIIMDLVLGSVTGVQLISWIHSIDIGIRPPIIVVSSGTPTPKMREDLYALGVLKIRERPADVGGHVRFIRSLRFLLCDSGDVSAGGSWMRDEPSPDAL